MSLNSRPARSTDRVLEESGLYRNTLSQKQSVQYSQQKLQQTLSTTPGFLVSLTGKADRDGQTKHPDTAAPVGVSPWPQDAFFMSPNPPSHATLYPERPVWLAT